MTQGDRVREAILDSKKSQAEIAAACGVTPSAVSQWMKGDVKELMGVTLARLAAVTEFEALWIADGAGPKRRTEKPLGEKQSQVLIAMEKMDPYQLDMLVKIADTVAKTPLEQTDPQLHVPLKKPQ